MSKFIDKLNRVSQAESQSMGFKAAKAVSPKPKMQLVASLAQAEVSDVADYVAGADTGLLPVFDFSSGAKTIQEISKAVSGIPWGGWLRDGGREGMKQLVKAGCDFVVFPAADTSLAILQGDEVGKILQVEASLSEGLLRAINELPVDAVLFVAGEQKEGLLLTWHHLMLFRRFASLLTKPLLVAIPSNVTAEELQALWDGGVGGVVVEVGAGQPTGGLKELRRAIDKLVLPSSRKQGKTGALLPYIGREKEVVAEEEEEV
ncbi:MAG: hypothetical protein CL875_00140 [Dehalococcoidales bacterium]|nr:hypothetical protein [Dehalococcoidales bacterium]